MWRWKGWIKTFLQLFPHSSFLLFVPSQLNSSTFWKTSFSIHCLFCSFTPCISPPSLSLLFISRLTNVNNDWWNELNYKRNWIGWETFCSVCNHGMRRERMFFSYDQQNMEHGFSKKRIILLFCHFRYFLPGPASLFIIYPSIHFAISHHPLHISYSFFPLILLLLIVVILFPTLIQWPRNIFHPSTVLFIF